MALPGVVCFRDVTPIVELETGAIELHPVFGGGAVTGFIRGEPVAEVRFVADPVPTKLELSADAERLDSPDSVRVMVRALDQAGQKLPFLFEPVTLSVSGAAKLVGPDLVLMRGGSAGFWVTGMGTGPVTVSVSHPRFAEASVGLVSIRGDR